MTRLALLFILFLTLSNHLGAQEVSLFSPNRNIEVRVKTSPDMTWSVYYKNKKVLNESKIALQVNDGYILGVNQQLVSKQPISIQNNTKVPISYKNSFYRSHYKGMVFTFRVSQLREYQIEFRVFDDGVAYRFVTDFENELLIENEVVQLNFPENTETYFPKERSFISHNEVPYVQTNLDTIGFISFASLPLLMKSQGVSMLFSEANVVDYPNMYVLANEKRHRLSPIFPHVVDETRPNPNRSDRNEIIVFQKSEVARTFGRRSFPWRYFLMSDNDGDLIQSNTPFTLSNTQKIWETSWIKPGRVVWDGYNANSTYQKEFGKEINSETYKYYIDFAAKYGFEYVLMDEGWSKTTTDITEPSASIDMTDIISYGAKRNVGILLWVLWKPLDLEMDSILSLYAQWGAKGIRVDYMQRSDQYMVNFYDRVAKTAAENKLVVSFHGSFKPSGLQRAYPNVLSFDGLQGNSYNKLTSSITPKHMLILPFVRMAAGPMDFAPGALNNVHPHQFAVSYDNPMSMGTRSRQLALFIIYESPLQVLCDAPTSYEKEPEIPTIISKIPTTWDETKVIKAKIGEELILARRKGRTWYLAGMTDATSREYKIPLSRVISPGSYDVTIVTDGENARIDAKDYEITKKKMTSYESIDIFMVPNGGWLAIFEPFSSSKKKKR